MALLFAMGILAGRSATVFGPFIAGSICTLPVLFFGRNQWRFAAVLTLTLTLGGVWGQLSYHPSLPEEGMRQVTGIISDEIRTGVNGQLKTVLTHVTLDGEPFPSGAYWSFYADDRPEGLVPGAQVSVYANLYHPSPATNPDAYDFREEMLRKNVTIGLYGKGDLIVSDAPFTFEGFTASLRYRLSQALIDRLGEESGGYASTMLLGLRSTVSGSDREAFSRLGIAHVLAVSGFHTGVLVAILALLFRLLRLPQKLRLCLCFLCLTLYSALCGWNMPVVRASVLVLLAMYGRILREPRHGLYLLSAVWILLLAVSPTQLTGLSFLLSFGAMLGLVLINPFLLSLVHSKNKVLSSLWSTLSAGVSAQLGILIPELSGFQTLPLLGLLINIPMSFLASGMIFLYWLAALSLPVPFLNIPIVWLAQKATELLTSGIRFLGTLDGIVLWTKAPDLFTVVGVLLLLGAMCGFLRFRARTRIPLLLTGLVITVLSVTPMHHSGTEYIQLDVGNADAAVLWDEDTVLVIDAGYDDGVLAGYLKRHRLTPDAVILTHLHSDHVYGLSALMDSGIPIPLCFLPEGAETTAYDENILPILDRMRENGTEFRSLSRGDRLDLPSGSFTVLWPEEGRTRQGQSPNYYSLAALLRLKDTSMLLTGDLDGRYEMYSAFRADILKLAHHGSVSSGSAEYMTQVSPDVLLLSCNTLAKHHAVSGRYPDIPLYSTAAFGALTLHFEETGSYRIQPFLSTQLMNGGDPDESE